MPRLLKTRKKLQDQIKFAMMTAFTAGMVNVASLVLFFSFTSNITGHYAILANEVANGNYFKIFIALLWILLYFFGSFCSHHLISHGTSTNRYLSHALPIFVEMTCLISVGLYGHYLYAETLIETELMVAVLLFAMGLQNGLTASISSFGFKTTHLTGLTTDLAIQLSTLLQKDKSKRAPIHAKLKVMLSIAIGYLLGGIAAGSIVHHSHFMVFIYIAAAMVVILIYDWSRSHSLMASYRQHRAQHHSIFPTQPKKTIPTAAIRS